MNMAYEAVQLMESCYREPPGAIRAGVSDIVGHWACSFYVIYRNISLPL